jgi:hypothetical protein
MTMTAADMFEELRFIWELLAGEYLFLLPFAQRKNHFAIFTVTGFAAFTLISQGYFLVLNILYALPSAIRSAGVAFWYILLALGTIPFLRLCFRLTQSDALYFCIGGYAAQHMVYALVHELLARVIWPELPENLPIYMLVTLCHCVMIYVLIYCIFAPQLRQSRGQLFEDKPTHIVDHGLLLTFLMIATFTCQHIFEYGGEVRIFGAIVGMLICMLILGVQYSSLWAVRSRQEQSTIHQMLLDTDRHFQLEKEMVDHINRTCHDLKHTLQVLKTVEEGERQRYIEEAQRDIDLYHQLVHCENEVLNTILAEKCLYCQKHDIRLSCAVDGCKLEGISVVDLYALLGNIIDNAIESVSRLTQPEQRVISLTINGYNAFTSIQINNYYEGNLTLRDGLPVTTKRDAQNHGIGLKSVRYLAEKYGGTMCISTQNAIFTLQVMLPAGQ